MFGVENGSGGGGHLTCAKLNLKTSEVLDQWDELSDPSPVVGAVSGLAGRGDLV